MDLVFLNNRSGDGWATLREITGNEEQSISSTSTVDVIKLLETLLITNQSRSLQKENVVELTPWNRDCLVAAVYMRIYGKRIESTVNCKYCQKSFDLDFLLTDLLETLKPENISEKVIEIEEGLFELSDGVQFRLPNGEDEYAVRGLSQEQAVQELLNRCIHYVPENVDIDIRKKGLQYLMEEISPILDCELDARCPECGREQQVHFDLQNYLLRALMEERPQLMREIHALASNYNWNLSEILKLPRSQRRYLANLIDMENDQDGGFRL